MNNDGVVQLLTNERVNLSNHVENMREHYLKTTEGYRETRPMTNPVTGEEVINQATGEPFLVDYINYDQMDPNTLGASFAMRESFTSAVARLQVFDDFIRELAPPEISQKFSKDGFGDFSKTKIFPNSVILEREGAQIRGNITVGLSTIPCPAEMTYPEFRNMYTEQLVKEMFAALGNGYDNSQAKTAISDADLPF